MMSLLPASFNGLAAFWITREGPLITLPASDNGLLRNAGSSAAMADLISMKAL